MATLDELKILITAETKGLREGVNSVKREVQGMEQSVQKATNGINKAFKAMAAAIAAAGIVAYAKSAINAASELESAMAGLTSIVVGHGQSMSNANKFIQSYIKDGLVPLTNAVTAYKNLASRGYTEEQIQTVMTRLKDSAAFGRQASYTLGKAVETATEGLKNENSILVDNAGVTKNVAKMWLDYAKAHGIAYAEMTKQQRIEAEVQGIIEETKFQVGDAAKATQTYSGRIAMLSATMQSIKVSIGQAFMPIANVVLPLLQTLANAVAKVASFLASFMAALFGVSKGQKSVAASADGVAASQVNAGQAATDAGDAATKAGKDAEKAGKKAKGALASFDEINQLSMPSDSGSSDKDAAGAGGGISTPSITMPGINDYTPPPIPEEIQKMVDKVKEIFQSLGNEIVGIGSIIGSAWSGIIPALQPFANMKDPIMKSVSGIGDTFTKLKDNVLVPFLKYAVLDFIPSLVIGFTQSFAPVIASQITWAFAEFDKTFRNLTDTVSSLWTDTWLPNLEIIKGAFLTAFPEIAGAIQSLLDNTLNPMVDFMLNSFIIPVVSSLMSTFVPIFTDTLVFAIQTFADTAVNAVSEINKLWSGTLLPSLSLVADAFTTNIPIIGSTLQSLLDSSVKPFVTYMLNDFIIPITSAVVSTLAPIFTDVLVFAINEFSKTFQNAVVYANELTTGTWIPSIDSLKDSFIKNFGNIGESIQNLLDRTIKPFVDYAINDFILPISAKITEVLVPILTDILVFAFEEIADVFKVSVDIINDVWDTVLLPIFDLLKEVVMDTLSIVQEAWDKHGKTILDGLSKAIDSILKIIQRLWDDVLKPIIMPFLAKVKELWDGTFKDIAKQMMEFVMNLIELGTMIYNKFISPLINYIIDSLAPAFVKGFNIALNIVTDVIKSIGGIIKGIMEVFNGLITFLMGAFTGDWGKAWNGVKDIFKGVFDSLWSIVKFPLNLIIDGVNQLISGLNKINIDIPDWVPGMGGKSFGVSIPSIPRLARGGIIDTPTIAQIGEAGPEAVVPLENTSFVNDIASAIGTAVMGAMQMSNTGNNSQSSQSGDIVLTVDGSVFARLMNPYMNSEQGRIGTKLITT
ncbi:phage tail protein [Paenibacillus sp. FSL H3-0333]|uniref:phage tail protein n=1 Tax=Paenibacillus sp. FSL H3-0333 TaxID=2921373 RepID=UPI0030F79D98